MAVETRVSTYDFMRYQLLRGQRIFNIICTIILKRIKKMDNLLLFIGNRIFVINYLVGNTYFWNFYRIVYYFGTVIFFFFLISETNCLGNVIIQVYGKYSTENILLCCQYSTILYRIIFYQNRICSAETYISMENVLILYWVTVYGFRYTTLTKCVLRGRYPCISCLRLTNVQHTKFSLKTGKYFSQINTVRKIFFKFQPVIIFQQNIGLIIIISIINNTTSSI